MMNVALTASYLEPRTSCLRAENAEKEVVRLKSEAEIHSLHEIKLVSKHFSKHRRPRRGGRWEVNSIFQDRLVQLKAGLEEMRKPQKSFGDYRECRDSVGAFCAQRETSTTRMLSWKGCRGIWELMPVWSH